LTSFNFLRESDFLRRAGTISALGLYQLITLDLLSKRGSCVTFRVGSLMSLGFDRPQNVYAAEEHKMLTWLIDTDGDWVLTIGRVVLGVVLFAHGAQKLLGWFGGPGLSASLNMFRDQLRIPVPLALLAIAAEFFGGLGLIVGLLTRIAALGIAITMLVAMVMVHLRYGFFLNWFGNKPGHGIEYHLMVIALAIVVMTQGAGAFSFDLALSHYAAGSNSVASRSMTGN